jgi:hypothetical protein
MSEQDKTIIRNRKLDEIIEQAECYCADDESARRMRTFLKGELSALINRERAEAKREARMELEVEIGLEKFGQLMKEKEKIRAEAYKKGAEDFCRWNCNNADGGYVQDLENFMQSEEYLSTGK